MDPIEINDIIDTSDSDSEENNNYEYPNYEDRNIVDFDEDVDNDDFRNNGESNNGESNNGESNNGESNNGDAEEDSLNGDISNDGDSRSDSGEIDNDSDHSNSDLEEDNDDDFLSNDDHRSINSRDVSDSRSSNTSDPESDNEENCDCSNINSDLESVDYDDYDDYYFNNSAFDSFEYDNLDCSNSNIEYSDMDNSNTNSHEDYIDDDSEEVCDTDNDEINISSDEDPDRLGIGISTITISSNDVNNDENENNRNIHSKEDSDSDKFHSIRPIESPICSIQRMKIPANNIRPKCTKPPNNMIKHLPKLRNLSYAKGELTSYPGCILFLDIKNFYVSNINSIDFMHEHKLIFLSKIAYFSKLVKSKTGAFLKELLLDMQSPNLIHFHHITNYETDLFQYPLVYGTIPYAYESAAMYFINVFKKQFQKRKLFSNKIRLDNSYSIALSEGEIEVWLYCYWELHTQDLIPLKNKICNQRIKMLLAYAWSFLSEGELKTQLTKYANFGHPQNVSKMCLYWIKDNFHYIISNISENKETENQAVLAWMEFMKKCNIHHYLCNHTINELHKRASKVKMYLNSVADMWNESGVEMLKNAMRRTKCVLCNNMTTKKLLIVNEKMHLPVCMFCFYFLNDISFDFSTLETVVYQNGPTLLKANGINRAFIDNFEGKPKILVIMNNIEDSDDLICKKRKTYIKSTPPNIKCN